ncbi:MAG TPA: DsbA family oxidoreductase [Candidatus Baltobacteraceae bacterium]|nr:DsbA family oxidoreductase [Candidatus Baltobacteraceae bacterium]
MRIDIWSDVVCPWCYIGVSRFERALVLFDGEVTIRLHPFQLDPDAPIPGIPARERYAAKFGAEAPAILERVTREAASEGLTFDFDRALTANTFDAHRAMAYAREYGLDRDLEKQLFRAYFTDGLDVSDHGVLADAGARLGLDRAELAAYLESDRGVDEVRRELVDGFERGITAVPSFVFEDEFLVPGAIDTASFVRVLEQMRAVR